MRTAAERRDLGAAGMSGVVGIEALNVYAGLARVPVREVVRGRGLDWSRFAGERVAHRSVALPVEDPVTNAVNAAAPLLATLDPQQRSRIEFLVTASESGLDLSKSLASTVHAQLGLDRRCRLLETKQACFAATAALQLAAGFVASGVSPGAKVLVIATDVALADADAGYAEPVAGHGAVAMLIGDRPDVLALDPGASGNHSFDVLDTARPGPELEIADPDTSLMAYLECLRGSVADYCDRVEGADVVRDFDLLAFHTPFTGMARAAHRALLRQYGVRDAAAVTEDFERRVVPSLHYPAEVGNLFSGALYLALASLVETAQPTGPARVGLFSYGSGCSSEFFSGVTGPAAARRLAGLGLRRRLDQRADLDFATYQELVEANRRCLVAERDRIVELDRWKDILTRVPDRPETLVLTGIEGYRRHYAWI
ncbi:hydroxymethylglutaryl-CoA synthase family protein [Micromonospora haikouensis]|uniref:hydroxymethylglutaryl-CoA synthase family protein n=1 Tax=Micromonospora haikouensis TaxID=686309 RepID=UPI003796EE07